MPKTFKDKVLAVVRKIPSGKTMSYKQVALLAGSPRACRAVGNIMNRYGGMEHGIPCHRVIKSDGTPGGYASGTKKKIAFLKKEGARISV